MEMSESGKPLITFALFSYNQEKYILDAVEAAFAQTYEPLEIVLSDDCSTDGTFELMQQAAARYRGAHKVLVRQTAENLGTLRHVVNVASVASGRLMVLAAGDDLSKCSRTSVLVDSWQATGAWGLCSRFDVLDDQAKLLQQSAAAEVTQGRYHDKFFHDAEGPVKIVLGSTSAYDARIFDFLVLSEDDFILSEDSVLSVMLNVMGKKIIHLDDSLVLYRQHAGSLTSGGSGRPLAYATIVSDEKKMEWFSRAEANALRFLLRIEEMVGREKARSLRRQVIAEDLADLEVRGRWSEMTFLRRLTYLARNMLPPRVNWALPRVFGPRPFFVLKWLYSRARSIPGRNPMAKP